MSSARSYLNAVLRDPDTTSVMAAPGPPGPLMTDKHDGTVNDFPVALVSTYSTAHILDPRMHPTNPDKYWDRHPRTPHPILSATENHHTTPHQAHRHYTTHPTDHTPTGNRHTHPAHRNHNDGGAPAGQSTRNLHRLNGGGQGLRYD